MVEQNAEIPKQITEEENIVLSHVPKELANKMSDQDKLYRSDQALMDETKRQEYYYMEKHDPEETIMLAHERKYGLRAIRDAIKSFFSFKKKTVIEDYDKLATSENAEDRKLKLHHSLGTKLVDEGQKVMEIDVGGSGYYAFRKAHAGFFKRMDTGSEHFKATFGEKIDHAKKGGIFKKVKKMGSEDKRIERFNISGPLAMKGLIDGGDYSINNIAKYVSGLGQDYIKNVVSSEEWQAKPTPINLNIQGHSRGGVGSTIGVKRILDWTKEHHPEAMEFLKINFIQYDPVPGPDSFAQEKLMADLRQYSDNLNTTTITSTYVDHAAFFTPMQVRGQKRIIIQANNHSVGLADMDITQKDAKGDQKLHRKALIDPKTKQAYRGSGMNEMDNAVFMQDANGTLVRMRSYGEAHNIIKMSRKGALLQRSRAAVLYKMIKNWFIDNEYVDQTETDEEYFEQKAHVDEIMSRLLDHKRFRKDSDLMAGVKSSIQRVQQARQKEMDVKARRVIYEDAIKACKKYMEGRDPSTDAGKERLRMVGDVLSQLRAELFRINSRKPN